MKRYRYWKIFFVLLGLSIFSILCVFPYVVTIQADVFKNIQIPLWQILVLQVIQSIILFSAFIFLGLYFTKTIQFQLPLLQAMLEKKDSRKVLKNIADTSILLGIFSAVCIYIVDILFAMQGSAISTQHIVAPVWQTLLASFYGGIAEEIVMRLFLMSFIIWISMKLFRQKHPSNNGIWAAIIIAAILFGLGHLPVTASLTEINTLIISRAIILNGIGGIIFGWLFWKKGLESAMIAHFTTDIFLLTLLPLLHK